MKLHSLTINQSFTVPVVTPFTSTEAYLKPSVSGQVELEDGETPAEAEEKLRPILKWLALRQAYLGFLTIRELQEAEDLEAYFREFFESQPECPELSET